MKVLIISLKNSERRDLLILRLKNAGIKDFEFIDAFDARKVKDSELKHTFDFERFTERYARRPARGEIGCTISHTLAWKICSNLNESCLVVEDDALFEPDFDITTAEILSRVSDISILGYSKTSKITNRLTRMKHPLRNVRKTIGKFRIGSLDREFTCGTVGYILTASSASRLLEFINKSSTPFFLADDFELYSKIVEINHIRPSLIYEDYKNIESTIHSGRDEQRSLYQKIKEKIKLVL